MEMGKFGAAAARRRDRISLGMDGRCVGLRAGFLTFVFSRTFVVVCYIYIQLHTW